MLLIQNWIRLQFYCALVGLSVLVAACVAEEPSNLSDQCNTISGRWAGLAQPPREVAELLAHTVSGGTAATNRPRHHVVWFQSEDSRVIRYCQYVTSHDDCDGTPDYRDFERINDAWRGGSSLGYICFKDHRK